MGVINQPIARMARESTPERQMNLEELIAANTAAMKENTAAVLASNALRESAIGTITAAASAAPATKAATKAAEKAAEKPAEKTETVAAAAGPVAVTAAEAETISGMSGKYMSGADREDGDWAKAERVARGGKVKALLQHDSVKVPGTPADKFDAACVLASAFPIVMATLESFISKGDLTDKPAAFPAPSALNL
jgi:hypothetical protein